jgi:tRNA 2-thiouridine synthesizing protein A
MDKKTLDVRGAKCPVPIVKAKQALDGMAPGEELSVLATDPGSVADFQGWVRTSKLATLKEQRTETEPPGRQVFVHVLVRKG